MPNLQWRLSQRGNMGSTGRSTTLIDLNVSARNRLNVIRGYLPQFFIICNKSCLFLYRHCKIWCILCCYSIPCRKFKDLILKTACRNHLYRCKDFAYDFSKLQGSFSVNILQQEELLPLLIKFRMAPASRNIIFLCPPLSPWRCLHPQSFPVFLIAF